MKGIILAAGRGERIGEKEFNKCLLKVANKPLIEYSLDRLAEIEEINEIIIVIGYSGGDISSKYGMSYKGKLLNYVYQSEQRGLVHALNCCKYDLNGEDFFLMLGDEIITKSRHLEMVKNFIDCSDSLFGYCGVVRITNREDLSKISKTYSIRFDHDWNIARLIEKPTFFPNIFMGTGNIVIKNEILDFISETPINIRRGREEKELPDLLQQVVDEGKIIQHFRIGEQYFNINTEEDLEEANNCIEK